MVVLQDVRVSEDHRSLGVGRIADLRGLVAHLDEELVVTGDPFVIADVAIQEKRAARPTLVGYPPIV